MFISTLNQIPDMLTNTNSFEIVTLRIRFLCYWLNRILTTFAHAQTNKRASYVSALGALVFLLVSAKWRALFTPRTSRPSRWNQQGNITRGPLCQNEGTCELFQNYACKLLMDVTCDNALNRGEYTPKQILGKFYFCLNKMEIVIFVLRFSQISYTKILSYLW